MAPDFQCVRAVQTGTKEIYREIWLGINFQKIVKHFRSLSGQNTGKFSSDVVFSMIFIALNEI